MLINSVILVLREVLEASLLVSLLLALTQIQKMSARWIVPALGLGFVVAGVYALAIGAVSQWFDGTGQEIANALMQYTIYLLILSIITTVVWVVYIDAHPKRFLPGLMIATVALAIAREGSEIFIYLSGFKALPDVLDNVIFGSLIGASIGCSIGALFYYLVVERNQKVVRLLSLTLLALVAAGMTSQATQLMMQADLLPSHSPVWDTSHWISEGSIVGQLLYALVGYEATPSLFQLIIYCSSLGVIFAVSLGIYLRHKELACEKKSNGLAIK